MKLTTRISLVSHGNRAVRALARASALFAIVAGCDTDPAQLDDADNATEHAGAGEKPVYALMTQVYGTNDDRTVYLSLSNTLDVQSVDLKQAREFPGVANFAAIDGRLMVSSGQEPSITAYEITDDLDWIERKTLSFIAYPLEDNANFYAQYLVDEHTAYLPFEISKRIIWDPAQMKISGVKDDTSLPRQDGKLKLEPGGNRNGLKFEGPVVQTFFFHDEDWLDYGTKSFVAIYDPDTHEETSVTELPCPGLSMTTQAENGYTYIGTWSYVGTRALYGDAPAPCMVRLKPDLSVDEAWTTDFTDVTDGHYVNNFRYIGNGKAIGNVLVHEALGADFSKPFDPDVDAEVWKSGKHWRFWMFDVDKHEAWPVEGIDEALGSGAQFAVLDRRTFVFLPFDEWSKSAVYEIDDEGKATRRFEVTGDVFKWVRVR
jgi:hypothetical protein